MRIGIDLGGTKIEILALDDQGHELMRQRTPTPQNDYPGTLKAIYQLINSVEIKLSQQGTIGICGPGSLSPSTGLLRNSNSVCLNGKPFKQDLEKLLKRETRFTNDANCFALSEATDGAAAKAKNVFGVIIGTGCGGGVVINRQVINGANAIGGEWGHNPLPWPQDGEVMSTRCWCGQNGCLETFLSGTGFEADYYQTFGEKLSAKDIVAATETNDERAEQIMARYEFRLAKSLAQVINILDPEVIVLGGGMSNVQRLYENVPLLWEGYIFSDFVTTKLVAPKYGDSSGVRGAAWLWNK